MIFRASLSHQGSPSNYDKRICLPLQETQVQSLGQKDPVEKEVAQPTPIFFPGKSHEQRSLVGYSPLDR